MERACFTLTLVPGTEEEYDRRHQHTWPDMIAAIQDAGLRNFTGFRRGTEVVYYVECHPSRDEAFARMDAAEVNARWTAYFDGIIASRNDPSGRMFFLTEMSHVD